MWIRDRGREREEEAMEKKEKSAVINEKKR